MRSRTLAAAAVFVSAVTFVAQAELPQGLADLRDAAADRVTVIDALPKPSKQEKKERKWLIKAGDALAVYQGVHDKTDLKRQDDDS